MTRGLGVPRDAMRGARWASRRCVHVALAAALTAWATPVSTLPAALEPYFAAIQQVESRGHPWSIFDNTTRRSYRLASRAEAEAKARELIQYGHNLDLGLMQLNCKYQCRREGVSLDNIFEPETNLRIARTVFLEFWEQARRVSTDFAARVAAAVGAYNNGRVAVPNPGYVDKVWRQMGRALAPIAPAVSGDPDGAIAPATSLDGRGPDGAWGQAGGRAAWLRERVDAIAEWGNSKGRSGGQTQDGRSAAPEASSSPLSAVNLGEMAMGLGLIGGLAFGGLALVGFIKVFGAIKVWRAVQLARAMSQRQR